VSPESGPPTPDLTPDFPGVARVEVLLGLLVVAMRQAGTDMLQAPLDVVLAAYEGTEFLLADMQADGHHVVLLLTRPEEPKKPRGRGGKG